MASNIYNEGRVVGYSAYEIYVRHALSINPNIQPASELEWLSSSIATGSSMILRINGESPSISGHHFQEVALPANSQLGAANTIIGSLFLGTVNLDSSGRWATNVTSYGPLLDNDIDHPTPGTPGSQAPVFPVSVTSPLDSTYQNNLNDYMKIVDGIVIQQGEWVTTEGGITPPKDLTFPDIGPNSGFARQPKVRILLSDTVVQPFYILLTGFTLKAVLPGVTGMDGSTDTEHPENGDFLGPAVFPWANKIVFSVPPAYINYYVRSEYARALNYSPLDVENIPIIDMVTTDPATYYGTNYTTNPISYNITKANTVKGDAVLTVYQRSSVLPPALYGTKVTATGNNKLYPLDTVAPGTVKIFDSANNQNEANAVNNIPGNVGMYRDADYIIHQTVPETASDPTDPISDVEVIQPSTADRADLQGENSFIVEHTSGKKSAQSISLLDDNGDELNRLGNDGVITPGPADQPGFVLTTQEPIDWETGYRDYYLHYTDYPYYRQVSKVQYGLTEQEPSDWTSNWTNYYTRIGTPPYVSYQALVVEPTPTWQEDTYYSPNGPTWQADMYYRRVGNSYQLTTSEPSDWSSAWQSYYQVDEDIYWTTWYKHVEPASYTLSTFRPGDWGTTWKNYYTNIGEDAYLPATNWEYGIYYKQGAAQEFIPTWEPNAYYKPDNSYGGTLHWNDLLYSLANNKSIDILNTTYFQNRLVEELANNILRAGAGISLQYNEDEGSNTKTIDIINTAIDTSKLPSLDKNDYTVLYKYQDGCCGQFRINDPDINKLIIKYSPAKKGVPASLYITSSPNNYLICNDFERENSGSYLRPLPSVKLANAYSSRPKFYSNAFWQNTGPDTYIPITTKPSDWDTGTTWRDYYKIHNQFWFRHTNDTISGIQLSRMIRIKLNFNNIVKGKTLSERLNLVSITTVTDTSESSTGIWNIGTWDSVQEKFNPVGASWQAGCKIEACNTTSFFIYGISYADGWNTQIGAGMQDSYPHGAGLMSNHINLKVSAMLGGTLYEDSI